MVKVTQREYRELVKERDAEFPARFTELGMRMSPAFICLAGLLDKGLIELVDDGHKFNKRVQVTPAGREAIQAYELEGFVEEMRTVGVDLSAEGLERAA